MKYIFLLIIFLAFNGFSQNTAFYKDVPGFPNVKYYNQVNNTPYVFKNGVLLSESVYPNWYKGLMYHKSPGIFTSVEELYSYLGDDPRFTQNPVQPSTYDHKTDPEHQMQYFELGKHSLNQSKQYLTDMAFLEGVEAYPTYLYERYSIVHREVYLKIDNDEFLALTVSSMSINYIPTATEIQKITNYINGDTTFKSQIENCHCLFFTIFHKEDGKWKFLGDGDKAIQFITDKNLDPILTGLLKNAPDSATVVSTINSSNIRIYTEH